MKLDRLDRVGEGGRSRVLREGLELVRVLADWARSHEAEDDDRVAVLDMLGKVVGYVRKRAERGRLRPVGCDVIGGQGGAEPAAADKGEA